VTAFEIDPGLAQYLTETSQACRFECDQAGIQFEAKVLQEDFIEVGVSILSGDMFARVPSQTYDCAIDIPSTRCKPRISAHSSTLSILLASGTAFLAVPMEAHVSRGGWPSFRPVGSGLLFNRC